MERDGGNLPGSGHRQCIENLTSRNLGSESEKAGIKYRKSEKAGIPAIAGTLASLISICCDQLGTT